MIAPRKRSGALQAVGTFALGAAIGSAVALLFAPASGRVTRRRIGMKLRTLQRESGRRLGQAQRILARKALDLREAAAQRVHGAQTWVAHRMGNGHERRATRRRVLRHA